MHHTQIGVLVFVEECLIDTHARAHTATWNSTACVTDWHAYTRGSAVHRPRLSFPAACSCLVPPPEPAGVLLSRPLPPTARVRALIPVATHQGLA